MVRYGYDDKMGGFHMDDMHTVFVYGTLRRHERYHHLLQGAVLVAAQAKTHGELYDTGLGYPAMVVRDEGWVYGEVYRVTNEQLARLDELEGYKPGHPDSEYHRIQVSVETDQGPVLAYTYVYDERQTSTLTPIRLGDWKAHVMRKQEWLHYFAYGSAMDDHRLILQGVQSLFRDIVGRGVLSGYSLQFTIRSADGSRADIVEGQGVVEGKVYRIGQPAVDYLFEREGVYKGRYRPAFVDVATGDGQEVQALTFVVCDKQPEVPPPYWYAEEILRGADGTVSPQYFRKLLTDFREKFHMTFPHVAEEEA
jgi:gamma-glutamylcyclotransferase (GGCT)/AIG2-like uncharacterized protein YtfP